MGGRACRQASWVCGPWRGRRYDQGPRLSSGFILCCAHLGMRAALVRLLSMRTPKARFMRMQAVSMPGWSVENMTARFAITAVMNSHCAHGSTAFCGLVEAEVTGAVSSLKPGGRCRGSRSRRRLSPDRRHRAMTPAIWSGCAAGVDAVAEIAGRGAPERQTRLIMPGQRPVFLEPRRLFHL